jgi:hypothetical protein
MANKATVLPKGHKKDLHGNPEGTTYNEKGLALHEGYEDNLLVNRPQPTGENPILVLYNPDGTVWTKPEGAEAKIQSLKADAKGLDIAINNGENKIATLKTMLGNDEADNAVFNKKINSEQIAVESNKAAKVKIDEEINELRLSLITPAQRSLTRELEKLEAQEKDIKTRLAEVREKLKVFIPATAGTAPAAPAVHVSTDEQKANHQKLVTQYGSQGKAIVALVKEGWTNSEIAKHMGIPPASVPGPKNVFLTSEAGQAYELVAGRAKLKAKV